MLWGISLNLPGVVLGLPPFSIRGLVRFDIFTQPQAQLADLHQNTDINYGQGKIAKTSTMESIFFSKAKEALIFLAGLLTIT